MTTGPDPAQAEIERLRAVIEERDAMIRRLQAKERPPCRVAGCDLPRTYARQTCEGHTAGHGVICVIEWCHYPVHFRSIDDTMCENHQRQVAKYGHPIVPREVREGANSPDRT